MTHELFSSMLLCRLQGCLPVTGIRARKTVVVGGSLVSPEDLYKFASQRWRFDNQGYVRTGQTTKLHREIMETPENEEVDHINGVRHDNRRENLRNCTRGQNHRNLLGVRKHNTSGYLGVIWHKRAKKWYAMCKFEGKKMHIGYFDDPVEAAKAYDDKVTELDPEFHSTNKSLGLL